MCPKLHVTISSISMYIGSSNANRKKPLKVCSFQKSLPAGTLRVYINQKTPNTHKLSLLTLLFLILENIYVLHFVVLLAYLRPEDKDDYKNTDIPLNVYS